MLCRQCFRDASLIRGLCDQCAPQLHQQHARAMSAVNSLTDRFKLETGKDALAHWYEYEAWVESNIEDRSVGPAVTELCTAIDEMEVN